MSAPAIPTGYRRLTDSQIAKGVRTTDRYWADHGDGARFHTAGSMRTADWMRWEIVIRRIAPVRKARKKGRAK